MVAKISQNQSKERIWKRRENRASKMIFNCNNLVISKKSVRNKNNRLRNSLKWMRKRPYP